MFPIRDHNPSGRTPYVVYALILINITVFLIQRPTMSDDVRLMQIYFDWALIPEQVSNGKMLHTLLTSMFMHGGWMHIAGNMLFLWIFGDNLEDEMGHFGFLLFYVLAGVGAALAQIIPDPLSKIPMIGASGAIAGAARSRRESPAIDATASLACRTTATPQPPGPQRLVRCTPRPCPAGAF